MHKWRTRDRLWHKNSAAQAEQRGTGGAAALRKGALCVGLLLITLALTGCTASQVDAHSLTVFDGGSSEPRDAAAKAMPETHITFIDEYFWTDDMLFSRLVTHDSTVDVYTADGTLVSLDQVFDKGFALPITDEALRTQVQEMYPALVDAVTVDGQIYAVPIACSMLNDCNAYDTEVLTRCQEQGLTLPTTWLELLEMISSWDEALWQEHLTPIGMDEQDLYAQSIQRYITTCAKTGETVAFESEAFQRLLDATRTAGRSLTAHAAFETVDSRPLFCKGDLKLAADSATAAERLALLPLWAGAPEVLRVGIYVMFVNPYGKHPEQAQAFMRNYLNGLSRIDRMDLSPKDNAPIIDTGTQTNRDYWVNMLADAQARLASETDDAARVAIRDEIGEWEARLASVPEVSYWVDDASIARYHAGMAQAYVTQKQFDKETNVAALIDQAVQGRISTEEMCRELARIWRMQQMEESGSAA